MDTDALMNAFIDGRIVSQQPSALAPSTHLETMRASLFDIPENLRVASKEIVEDDLNKSAGMLTCITEVWNV